MLSNFTLTFVVVVAGTSVVLAQQDETAFFEQKIRPVLAEHCYACHSATATKLKGNLLLDSKAGWQKGGDSGQPAIVPGDPEASPLIRAIRHLDAGTEMPPDKPQLPTAVIGDFVAWVKLGAVDPRDGATLPARRGDKSWWSLQPLVKKFSHETIDGFIAAALAEKGLASGPPADARTLIRRMTYDVLGLPPTPAEVAEFESAYRADRQSAVAALVDRLLASPAYGEQWGRHWLDVIRFGESIGFERNVVIDDLWPFRDYVIRSLNEDKPFNRFIVEHLAGDVIGKDDPRVEVGSAFLVAGPYDDVGNQDVVAQANIRAATLDDMITAASGAFLGLTINCARCHDHKFDPIPSADYYRLRAAVEGVTHGRRVIATPSERRAFADATRPLNERKEQLTKELDALNAAINGRARVELTRFEAARPKIDPQRTEEPFEPIRARAVRFVIAAFTENPRRPAARQRNTPPPPAAGRLTEFEVWSKDGRNVALAASGATAAGAKSAVAEDFPAAYGPHLCIDGLFGEQWFIGSPPVLTVTLAREETIDRVVFSNAKGKNLQDKAQGSTPCEYEVQVSLDGQVWQTVATSDDRQPWSEAHGIARLRHRVITTDEESRLAALESDISAVQKQLNAVPKLPQVWAGNFAEPNGPTFVHKGGDPMKPGDAVAPASLSVLDRVLPAYELPLAAPEAERRLALARWIASDANPLTARVLANRVWQYHFGQGLVDTPSDFGFLGGQPSHPQLLDFLARRLLDHGWQLKPLHREILLSQAYQQASTYREPAARIDKEARLLWRFPPRRLSAEELRDTLLHIAGALRLEPRGGPGFRLYKFTQNNVCTYFPLDKHGPETYRRAVYHQNARASIVDLLTDFDLPDIAFAAPRRANTTTPLQSLTLLNHQFTWDMAQALAARLSDDDPATAAYTVVLQRPPTSAEQALAIPLLQLHGRVALVRALLNSNEMIYVD